MVSTRTRKKKRRKVEKRKAYGGRRTRKNSEARTRKAAHCSKLTKKLIAEIKELIEEGLPLDSACAYLGITHHTLYDWKEKGEKYLIELASPRGPEFPEDELFAEFMLTVAKSRAALELELIRDLRDKKALARWVRNMTILERRFRRDWSRSESLRVETEQTAPDEAYL